MVNRPTLAPEIDLQNNATIWIVFSNNTDIRMLRILRHGFRHCFAVMQIDDRWILIDPKSNKTDVNLLPHPATFNFPKYFSQQGMTVMKLPAIQTPQKIMMPFCFSCVETMKRFIGLHQFWVLTPYQLYKSILKIQQKG